MKTNFFEQIATLEFQGALNLNMTKNAEGFLTVSVYLPNLTTDTAGNIIPPMILKGHAAELDEGFFDAIAAPVKQTSSLFANMDAYQQSLKKAAESSKAEVDKKNKANKAKTTANTATEADDDDEQDDTETLFSAQENEQKALAEKKKRYENAMTQVSELNKLCKYAEAIALLPSVDEYPEHTAEIESKRTTLEKRKSQYEELMQEV
jgi:PRTRC genetic system protein E